MNKLNQYNQRYIVYIIIGITRFKDKSVVLRILI